MTDDRPPRPPDGEPPRVTILTSLTPPKPLSSQELGQMSEAQRRAMEVHAKVLEEFTAARARTRAGKNIITQGNDRSLTPEVEDTRIKTFRPLPDGELGEWRGVLFGTGGKRKLYGPT